MRKNNLSILIFIFIITSVSFFSCKKEKDTPTPNSGGDSTTKNWRLAKSYVGGVLYSEYHYNDNNTLTDFVVYINGDTYKTTYIYLNNGKIDKRVSTKNETELTTVYKYIYSNDTLIQIKWYDDLAEQLLKTTDNYLYENSRIWKIAKDYEEPTSVDYTTTYTYGSQGEVLKIEITSANDTTVKRITQTFYSNTAPSFYTNKFDPATPNYSFLLVKTGSYNYLNNANYEKTYTFDDNGNVISETYTNLSTGNATTTTYEYEQY